MKITNYERVKQWRKSNPEKSKEQWKRYYDKHSERIKSQKRENYKLNK